jgi:hypothetical protein
LGPQKRAGPSTGMAQGGPAGVLVKRCQDLLKRRLSHSLLAMFRVLTGSRLHVCWGVDSDDYFSPVMPIKNHQ